MPTQTYATHRHSPTATLVAFFFFLVALAAFGLRWFGIGGRTSMALGLGAMLAVQFVLIGISRTYITKLQDRIIRVELRMRCAALLSAAQQEMLARLSMPQLVALRFASDAELPALLERATREQMTPTQIKQAVATWVPDLDRT